MSLLASETDSLDITLSAEQAGSVAQRVIQAINARDRSAIEALAHDDVQLRMPPGQVFYGCQEVHRFFDELESRLPDLTVTADSIRAGDDFAVVEWESAGRTRRHDPDEEMGALVLHLRDGRIDRAHLYLDLAHWDRLGAERGT
jgi:ketosteroid isomerase-like protein